MEWIMEHSGPAIELATKYGPMSVHFKDANELWLEAGKLGSRGEDAVFTYQGKRYRAHGHVHSVSGEFCTFRRDDRSPVCGHTRRHNHGEPWFTAAGSTGVSRILRREMVEVLAAFLETGDARQPTRSADAATLLAVAEVNHIARQLEAAEHQAAGMRATLVKVEALISSSRTQLADLLVARGPQFRNIPDVSAIIQRAQLPAGCHTPA
jgi:hypothetical protein